MEPHERISHLLITYLKSKGVPDNAIALNWGVKHRQVADLVLLATEYSTPVSIFEIRTFKNQQTLDAAKNCLRKIISLLNITVSCYLVFGKANKDEIEIFEVTDSVYNDSALTMDKLPELVCENIDFVSMQNGIEAKNNADIVDKKKDKQSTFNKICFAVIPLYLILVLILDYQEIYAITVERLWVYGIMAVIVLLPFFKEISLGPLLVKKDDSEERKK